MRDTEEKRPGGPGKAIAALTFLVAFVAGAVPTVWSYLSNRENSVEVARGVLSATAETSRDRIRAFLGEKSAALSSLAANPEIDTELNTVLNPPAPPPAKEDDHRRERELTEEEQDAADAAAKAAADKVLSEVYAKAQSRFAAFCKSTKGCKRVLATTAENKIVVSTDARDKGGTFGGSLVKMALKTSQPMSLVAKSVMDSMGAYSVVAARTQSKQYVLAAAFDTSDLFSGLAKLREPLGSTARIIVADRGKLPLLGGMPSKQGKVMEFVPVSRALDGEADVAEALDENEVNVLAAWRPVGEAGLATVVTRQMSAIRKSGAPIPWGMAITALLIALLGTFGVYFRATLKTDDDEDRPRRGSGQRPLDIDRPPIDGDFAPNVWDQRPPGDDGLPPLP
jgi:hypothetical protein